MNAAPRARWRGWVDESTIAAALAALAMLIALGGGAWRLERLIYDSALAFWTRPPPADIVIVAIDDASIDAIGRWPWSRAVHATLLETLAAAKPRAIALDLVLSEADPDPRQDALLARALVDAAPVVLPVSWRSAGAGRALGALEPVEPLRSAARLGAAEAPVDADGVLRHAFLHAGTAGIRYPHLALALLEAGGESPHPALRTVDTPDPTAERDGRFLIRYAGPPGTFERLSYVDVLRGAVAADRLAGRYVLIGMTAQGLGDTLATPVNANNQAMPGIEVLANTLATLKRGDAIFEPPPWRAGAGAAVALLLLLLAFRRFGPRAALPLALGSVPVALAASALSLRAGVWWNPLPYALPALLAYPLWSWRRLERAMSGLDREIVHLASAGRAPDSGAAALQPAHATDKVDARLQTLRQATDLVRDARRFLADALAALPTAMLVADEDNRVLLANPIAATLFDHAGTESMRGKPVLDLLARFTTRQAIDWSDAVVALRDGAGPLAIEAGLGADSDHVLHVAAVTLQGRWRLVITIADIAPVKRAQRQREEVLAFVSHDLRSPAHAIVMLVDLNRDGVMQTPHDELLQEVRRLAERTLAMSENFVRTAHAETILLDRGEVTIAALLADSVADHRAAALARHVDLQLHDAQGSARVSVDRALVTRALGNLVANAITHSPEGAVVDIDATVADGKLRLGVRDRGPGLSAAQHAQLMRGEGARAGSAHGVGLGLLFVQRVARRHDGCLIAGAAADGRGALFELVLSVGPAPST